MKNITKEKPTSELHGRVLYSAAFVDDNDIRDKKILDIGCGFGWMEINLLERGASRITGLEISNYDLETARGCINNPIINFTVGSAINLPFNNEAFDTIISWEVIEHIPANAEDAMFREVYRALKPNGVFYLSTPNNSFFAKIFDPAWWLINHRHYSAQQLINWGTENGFNVNKFARIGGLEEILWINNLYIAKWIFRRKPFFEKFLVRLVDRKYRSNSGYTNIILKFVKGFVAQ